MGKIKLTRKGKKGNTLDCGHLNVEYFLVHKNLADSSLAYAALVAIDPYSTYCFGSAIIWSGCSCDHPLFCPRHASVRTAFHRAGIGRDEPNANPHLPEPETRVNLTAAVLMGPFAIIKEIFGPGVRTPFHLSTAIQHVHVTRGALLTTGVCVAGQKAYVFGLLPRLRRDARVDGPPSNGRLGHERPFGRRRVICRCNREYITVQLPILYSVPVQPCLLRLLIASCGPAWWVTREDKTVEFSTTTVCSRLRLH
eukprot:COSAG02_NODE_2343_length_9101_cov_36.420684_2_plen_253_part_00